MKNIIYEDLIGKQKVSSEIEAIEYWKYTVLDSLEEASSTVTKRFKSLLDMKYDGNDNIFNVFKNPNNFEIKINNKFRLVYICELEKLKYESCLYK